MTPERGDAVKQHFSHGMLMGTKFRRISAVLWDNSLDGKWGTDKGKKSRYINDLMKIRAWTWC